MAGSLIAPLQAAEPERSAPVSLLVFEIAGQFCGLAVGAVQEIAPMAALARSPGQPRILEGFLNLRGSAIPVVRLDRLFDLAPLPPALHTPIVVLKNGIAILTDRVIDIVTVAAADLQPIAPDSSFNQCAQSQIVRGSRAIHLLSEERLLLNKERQCVAELQARAQEYLDELEPRA